MFWSGHRPGVTCGYRSMGRRVVGLRNRLAHGYDDEIDDTLIWSIVQESLPVLRAQIGALLPEFKP